MVSASPDVVLEEMERVHPGSVSKAGEGMVGVVPVLVEPEDEEFEAEVDALLPRKERFIKELLAKGDTEKAEELAKMMAPPTEAQADYGKLLRELKDARSLDQIENAFDWWHKKYTVDAPAHNGFKVTAFITSLGSFGGLDDAHYRILRRMFLKASMAENDLL